MMTETEYLYAWLYYLGGAFIMVVCLWFLVRKLRSVQVKTTLLVVVAAMLTVPWYSDPLQSYLSPAFIISVVEGFFEGPDAFWRAGTPMLIAMGASFLLCVIGFTLAWYFKRSAPEEERNIPPSISDVHLD